MYWGLCPACGSDVILCLSCWVCKGYQYPLDEFAPDPPGSYPPRHWPERFERLLRFTR
jgi:hypothetical protein